MKYLIYYLIFINVISSLICIIDKQKAKKYKWRVRESTLFILSFLGGSPFMYITMKIIHHKTKHKKFMIGIPLIFLIQVLGFYIYFNFFA